MRKQTFHVPGGSQKRVDDASLVFRTWRQGWLNGTFDGVAVSRSSVFGQVVTRQELVRRLTERARTLGITLDNDSRFAAEVARIEGLDDHDPTALPACSSRGLPQTAPTTSASAGCSGTNPGNVPAPSPDPVYIVIRGREPGIHFDR